jgi:hypothetical protein
MGFSFVKQAPKSWGLGQVYYHTALNLLVGFVYRYGRKKTAEEFQANHP